MALTSKTVSLAHVIEKVQSTYGFLKEVDNFLIAEHVFDAMGLIGSSLAYENKVTDGVMSNQDPITITNHRGELPCDLFEINSCKEGTYSYAMIEDTSTFQQQMNDSTTSDDRSHPITYSVRGGYIFTKFQTGTVVLDYIAFPTDTDGLPLIPDNVRYIRAVVSYVAERIGLKLWMEDKIAEKKYRHLEQDWFFNVGSAGVASKMPRMDKHESIKNMMVRMIHNSHHHMFQHKHRQVGEALKIK